MVISQKRIAPSPAIETNFWQKNYFAGEGEIRLLGLDLQFSEFTNKKSRHSIRWNNAKTARHRI